jgi:hypothetical protein
MNTVKSLALVALLLGGTSLALAQNGPPTGGQPPTAAPASPGPPPPGVILHDAPRTQATAPGPNLQSAAPGPGPSAETRIARPGGCTCRYGTSFRAAPWVSRPLRHAPAVRELVAVHCCANQDSGATIRSHRPALSKARL